MEIEVTKPGARFNRLPKSSWKTLQKVASKNSKKVHNFFLVGTFWRVFREDFRKPWIGPQIPNFFHREICTPYYWMKITGKNSGNLQTSSSTKVTSSRRWYCLRCLPSHPSHTCVCCVCTIRKGHQAKIRRTTNWVREVVWWYFALMQCILVRAEQGVPSGVKMCFVLVQDGPTCLSIFMYLRDEGI